MRPCVCKCEPVSVLKSVSISHLKILEYVNMSMEKRVPFLYITCLLFLIRSILINPHHACTGEGYCTWSVCVCVCARARACMRVCVCVCALCPPFFSTTVAILSFKRGYVLR